MGVPEWVILLSVSLFLVISSLLVVLLVISRRSRTPITPEQAQSKVLTIMSKLGVKIPDDPSLFIPSSMPTPSSSSFMKGLLIILLFVLVDAGGAYFGWRTDLRAYQLLRSEGQVIRAEVTDQYIVSNDESSDDYYIVYSFQARGSSGETAVFSRKVDVGSDHYDEFEKGGTAEVIYAPSDPSISRLTVQYNPNFPNLSALTIITSVLVVMGLPILLAVYASYQGAARLDTEGTTTYARILDLNSIRDSEGSASYYVVYEMENNRKVKNSISKKRFQSLSVGSSLRVRYLVEKPSVYRVEWDQ